MNRELIGKEYSTVEYEVSREKIKEYAKATLSANPFYFDPEFAGKSKHGTVVAPPTFAAVYSAAVMKVIFEDRDLGMEVPRIVHGEQKFVFGEVVRAGDLVTTGVKIENIFQKTNRAGVTNEFLIIKTTSLNQDEQMVCEGTCTLIERGKQFSE
ncbi:MAG: MaoC family dehydratase N-terminal domain-containing protein [Candidatus Marinimicrobia bacterium]|jgi:acyl dehydratase|nr:hypothetical protein [Candidatus Neomarinimicrobiota bacterium]MDP6455847.1 MaoC family dehydratase N-terminal domain-containing protein [Candidatus Neomarinimicrobiota bacterium]MDP6593140.1 MaoC family dehydratase N-terminal domain-containing protein [Candidatus Neomarinimicrobiota bacterium]MDP6837135.1 MaoC family dehydratase N-terminal domain-containing protein [Candidatus Neomarinimicrobiota bacterium]MDP6966200.1 MaoC family dehydratase N-terminal domain-containing protein [Candidatus|tara:strand:- start:540 stop:1001 length:462 start_codon:yes stop_codon:yes gene_type:complete